MQRVKRSTAVSVLPASPPGGTPGYFAKPDPAGGIPATVPGFEWYNNVQEEQCNIVEAAGFTLDEDDHRQVLKSVVNRLISGKALPTENIGPIWHDDYNSIMTWQAFTANGANYTGYASVLIGSFLLDTQPTPRVGYVKNGTPNLSRNTYAALRAWAQHNGIMVDAGIWAAGKIVVCDNPDGLTFKIYDVRGEGLRIWDDSRGVDSGRAFGSWQKGSPLVHDDTGGESGFTVITLGDNTYVAWSEISDPWTGTVPLTMYKDISGSSNNASSIAFVNMMRMRNTAFSGMVKF